MIPPAMPINLPAYFNRIGLSGPTPPTLETLRAIQFHHACSIPFENLDVLLKRGIALDLDSLQNKLITNRRGGYCFEQNWLLLHVLRDLGFNATPLAARVRFRQPRDFVPPRTHIFVRVDLDGEQWLADVGVGGLSPTAPIRFVVDEEQTSPHEPRRIIRENDRYYHQVKLGPTWEDVCEFTGEEMYAIDREVGNWWTSTNPNSKFAQNIMAARANPDGTRFVLENQNFAHRRASDGHVLKAIEIKSSAELLDILNRHFALSLPADTKLGIHGL
jgi:N-hydroxyarylamine O-acetyltransferase